MNVFRVGDRVRLVNALYGHNALPRIPVGTVGRVMGVEVNGPDIYLTVDYGPPKGPKVWHCKWWKLDKEGLLNDFYTKTRP